MVNIIFIRTQGGEILKNGADLIHVNTVNVHDPKHMERDHIYLREIALHRLQKSVPFLSVGELFVFSPSSLKVFIFILLRTTKQFIQTHLKEIRDLGQKLDIGINDARLPTADRLKGHTHFFRKSLLRKASLTAKFS